MAKLLLRPYSFILLFFTLFLLPVFSFAGTGILEVYSEPSGAHISIDGLSAGETPYQNLDAPAGKHRVKAFLSSDYPVQIQDVVIEERTPSVILFRFRERSRGKFTGKEIVSTAMKHRGNVTFASIPSGALVNINGEPVRKRTPVGYTDVEVGRYYVEFRLDGRALYVEFDVIQDETVMLVADFENGTVINKWEQAKSEKQPAEDLQKDQAMEKHDEDEQEHAARQKAAVEQISQQTTTPQTPVETGGPAMAEQPQPEDGVPPYGELIITVNVRRDPGITYSDFIDILFPKLPMESLSGPLFPKESSDFNHAIKDNFEYINDDTDETRKITGRIGFGSGDTAGQGTAKSGILSIEEGKYDLTISMRRMINNFLSAQKVHEEANPETVEIVRGFRSIVNITGQLTVENKLHYEINKTFEPLRKKKS